MKDKNNNYGKAVVKSMLRYLSASSITAFDPSQSGGCNARWWFEKIDDKKPPEQAWQNKGKKEHSEIEHYLTTGQDILSVIVRQGKHFIPEPGPDLIVEKSFGDWEQALHARDKFIAGDLTAIPDKFTLSILGVPVMGAMDLRHRRGEWLDNTGRLNREKNPPVTAEVVDWKTTSDIGKWGKTAEQLNSVVQMCLYAKATTFVWPDINFVRISHGQFGTKRREARKVSVLLDREIIEARFAEISSIVRSMSDVAKEHTADKVDKNLNACNDFKGCPHLAYCPRPNPTINELFQIKPREKEEVNMGTLFDAPSTAHSTPTNGTPAIPQLTDEQRQMLIDQEKAKLLGQVAPTPAVSADPVAKAKAQILAGILKFDPGNGQIFTKEGADKGWIMRPPSMAEQIAFDEVNAAQQTSTPTPSSVALTPPPVPAQAPAPPLSLPIDIAAVNPPDRPPPDLVAQADPLPLEVIAQITNPELKARAEAHAAAHAQKAAEAAQAAGVAGDKTSGRCPGGKQRVALTVDDALAKKKSCPICGKEIKLKPEKDGDQWFAVLAGHLMSKGDEAVSLVAPPITSSVVSTPLPVPLPPPTVVMPPVIPFTMSVPAPIESATPSLDADLFRQTDNDSIDNDVFRSIDAKLSTIIELLRNRS